MVGASARESRASHALHGHDAHEIGGRSARRGNRAAPAVGSTWFEPVA